MKVKKQGWINVYKETVGGERYAGSIWPTKADAMYHWELIKKLIKKEMRGTRLQDTIQIEWEEEI